jgi:hypothetical protein
VGGKYPVLPHWLINYLTLPTHRKQEGKTLHPNEREGRWKIKERQLALVLLYCIVFQLDRRRNVMVGSIVALFCLQHNATKYIDKEPSSTAFEVDNEWIMKG